MKECKDCNSSSLKRYQDPQTGRSDIWLSERCKSLYDQKAGRNPELALKPGTPPPGTCCEGPDFRNTARH